MKHEQERAKHYADIIDEPKDFHLLQLVSDLDSTYTAYTPPAQVNWASLRTQRATLASQQSTFTRWFRPQGKLSLRASSLLAVLILSLLIGTVYASVGTELIDSILKLGSGTNNLLQTHQFKDFHQSQSIDGYTITLQKVYADASNVVVGYTIELPKGQTSANGEFAFSLSKMTTEQGISLPGSSGIGDTDKSYQGNVMFFDASNVEGNPKELHLSMAIPYGSQGADTPFHIKGYLTFDFSVPFHTGRVATIHRSLTVEGKTVTLEKVVVTNSEVRAYVQGISYKEADLFISYLTIDGKTYQENESMFYGMLKSSKYYGSTTQGITFSVPLMDKHGTWTLTIKQDPRMIKFNPIPVKGGPWTFQFIVP